VLLQHPRQPLSRDKLMELARGREYEVFDRAIDVQISRLRKLVEEDPSKPRYIQTVWGFGYVFVPDGNEITAPMTAIDPPPCPRLGATEPKPLTRLVSMNGCCRARCCGAPSSSSRC
jgi:DNA-binding winged helix-turn-helix (wHTH) protein